MTAGSRTAFPVRIAAIAALAIASLASASGRASALTIAGVVFEDVQYGGGAGRGLAASSGVPRPGARVELYDNGGAFVTFTTSDVTGAWSFAGLASGGYTVRVVNSTVSSSRTGYLAGTHLAVQTYRTNASGGVIEPVPHFVGGQNPTLADGAGGFPGVTLNTTTGAFTAGLTGIAQSITNVSLGGDLAGVDFGFNFDVVVNTNSAGQGSLRQFLINANGLTNTPLAQEGRPAGIENAIFMLADGTARPGTNLGYPNLFTAGVATITPTAVLPAITDPVILDAQTQAGWSSAPIVELKGTGMGGSPDGITVTAGNSTIRGFVVDGFGGHGVVLSTAGNNVVAGNHIGTVPSGASASRNVKSGVLISSSPGNLIGGTTAAARNLVSGNQQAGVSITGNTSTGNILQGNLIGLDATGTRAIPNLGHGIEIAGGASGTLIGGAAAGTGNVVSGNSSSGKSGIYIGAGSNNTIQGNRIGSSAAGDAAVPNGYAGVHVDGSADNRVGGTSSGTTNEIAYNNAAGVVIEGDSPRNLIARNSIYGNGGLGIDLGDNGVTPNDGTRGATAPNNGMDFPTFTSATLTAGDLNVAGYVGAAPGQATFGGSRVEIFRADVDPSGYGEGRTYLGFLTADASGNFSGTLTGTSLTTADKITATAIDALNHTSEFAGAVLLVDAITGTVFEDVHYGGGAGRDLASSAGAPRPGARVELYDAAGNLKGATVTDGAGAYAFSAVVAGTYTVRVVNGSVTSSRVGSISGLVPVQTFRTDAASGIAAPVTDHVGGEVPGKVDAGNGTTTLAALTTTATAPQSITTVTLGTTPVSSVDFGFCFDVIVNKKDAGQGSLRQFLVNANTLSNAGLAQVGRAAEIENAIFMLADGTARPGTNSGYASQFSSGIATIPLASALPTITDPVVIDAQVSGGGAVPPVIELNGSGAAGANGLTITAGGSTVRGLAVNRFPGIGILLSGAGSNRIAGNWLGQNPGGTESRGNTGVGIRIQDSPSNTIGGTSSADRNVIGDGGTHGIEIVGAGATGNVVHGNYVGVLSTGLGALENDGDGIRIASGASNNWIGGTTPGAGNVISGNGDDGIDIQDAATSGNTVQGNRIGTNFRGTGAIRNGDVGVLIENSGGNLVGGSTPAARNIVSGNSTDGIRIAGLSSFDNRIEGNYIGVDSTGVTALANLVHGIRISNDAEGTSIGDPGTNAIGGAGAGAANRIAGNGAAGVSVLRGAGIAILANVVFGNGGLGIDLGGNGVTANDGAKNAGLPNSDMDFPIFTSRSLVGTTLTVAGYVGSAPGQTRFASSRVEIFKSDSDASGHGEGRLHLGSLTTGTTGNFSGSLDVSGTGLTAGDAICGTATDPSGNTSEFGPTMPLVASLRGTVFEDVSYGGGAGRDRATSGGIARPNARVELYNGSGTYVTATTTDANGAYAFSGLLNDNYTVRVVNNTVSSSRLGYVSGTHLAVQTFRTDASSGTPVAATDRVGGQDPRIADAPNGKGGAVMNTLTGVFTAGISGTAQSFSLALVNGYDVSGIDFGYSFDVVVNTNNSGQGSLRQVLINANALSNVSLAQSGLDPGIENVVFMLPDGTARPGMNAGYASAFSGGVATISPASGLPAITDPLILDARRQPGWSGRPIVELNGTSAGSGAAGLIVSAGSSRIAGLVINRFRLNAITISGTGGNTIAGNFLGTAADGLTAQGNLRAGVSVNASPNNRIGGTSASDRNLVAGNSNAGIEVTGAAATTNRIEGNFIGVDTTGTRALANLNSGIRIVSGASGTIVGGTVAGAGNLVSGNGQPGILIEASSGTLVQGNRIGTDASGAAAVPNANAGVHLLNASSNTVGGATPGAANLIAFNDDAGVVVSGAGSGNAILGNVVHGNRFLGIDLGGDGVTANDGARIALAPNLGMDFPVLSGAVLSGPNVGVSGYVGTPASRASFAGARIEIFEADPDPSGHGEGRTLLAIATADTMGWFTATIPAIGIGAGDAITATATDASGNTSEYGSIATVITSSSADLSLRMSASATVVHELDEIVLTMTLTNLGPSPATGVAVAGTLPAGLGYKSSSASQGTYDPGLWNVGSLPAGGVATLAITVAVELGTSATRLGYLVTADANEADPYAADDTASVSILVQSWGARIRTGTYVGNGLDPRAITGVGFRPDVVLIKGLTNEPAVITTTNMVASGAKELGPATSLRPNLIRTLDGDGFTVGSDARVNSGGKTYSWVAFESDPGALVLGSYVGDGSNTRSVTGVGFQPDYLMVLGAGATQAAHRISSQGANKSLVFGPVAETGASIKTFDPDGFSLGNNSDVNGSSGLYYYVAWQQLPNAMAVGTYEGGGLDNSAILGAGFQPQFVIVKSKSYNQAVHRTSSLAGDATLRFQDRSTFSNGIQRMLAGGWEAGTDSTVNTNRATYYWTAFRDQPPPGRADLEVSIGVDDPNPNHGDTLTYTLLVQNRGPDVASGVIVTDLLGAGLEFVSANPNQGSYTPESGAWSVGSLAVGALQTMSLRARVDGIAGGLVIADTASITRSDAMDTDPSDNVAIATVTVQSADLAVSVDADQPNPNRGDTLTYTVTVTNAGPNVATGVVVRDRLPAGLTYLSAAPSQGSHAPATGLWSVGPIAVGGGATLSLRATVDASAAGATLVDTAMVAGADQIDPAGGNDAGTAAITVQSADLAVSVAALPVKPTVGDTLAFTVTVTNEGPSTATNVRVLDRVPAGLAYHGAVAGQGVYFAATGAWDVGTLASGASATLELRFTADPAAAGATFADTAAVVASDQGDLVAANDRATSTVTIQSADLAVSVAVNNRTPDEGSTIGYTVTLANAGPHAASNVTVRDLLPGGVTLAFGNPSAGTYDEGTGDWLVPSLAAGATATLGLVAVVDTGTVDSTIVDWVDLISATPFDPDTTNHRDSVAIRPLAAGTSGYANLDVSHSVAPASANVGDVVTFTITVNNLGPNDAWGIELTDDLPAGLTYSGSAVSQGSYAAGAGLWTIGALDAGDSATLSLSASVDAGAGGTSITNVATLSALVQRDTVDENNSRSATLVVQSADLAVTLAADRPAPNVGDTLTYTVTIANAGPDAASGVVVTDRLPSGLGYAGASPTQGAYAPATGAWSVGSLASGASATLLLRAVVEAAATGLTLVDTAWVAESDQEDPATGNDVDSVTVYVPSADLAVALEVDRTAPNVGDTLAYTITVANEGPDGASGVVIADRLPLGLTYRSSAASHGAYALATGLWSVGSLAAGDTASLTLRATVDPGAVGATIADTAGISAADQGDPVAANDSRSVTVTVQSADLAVTIATDRATADPGDTLTTTITLTNFGPDAATAVRVAHAQLAGFTEISSAPSQGDYDSGTGMWSAGDLANGASATLAITSFVNPGAAGATLVDTARVAGADQGDPAAANDADTVAVVVPSVDLAISVSADRPTPNHGDTLTWTVTVANVGPSGATGVAVEDRLPAGLTYLSDAPSQGSYAPAAGAWSVGSLGSGASATLALRALVDVGTAGATITDTARVSAVDQYDPAPANDAASASVVVQSVDLAVALTVDPANPTVGDTLTFMVTLSNAGPSGATGIVLVDRVPAGLDFQNAVASQGGYAPATGEWTVGALASGGSATLALRATAPAAQAGVTFTDTASVAACDQGDVVSANDGAITAVTVQSADLSVSLAVSNPTPDEGGTIAYTVTLANQGPHAASGITVQDRLPAGVTLAYSDASAGTYTPASGDWFVSGLAPGASATLDLVATVDFGTADSTIVNAATLVSATPFDPVVADNAASIDIHPLPAGSSGFSDIDVAVSVAPATANVGDTVVFAVTVRNLGPDPGPGIEIRLDLAPGLTHSSSAASQGVYSPATGLWGVGGLFAGDSATLSLRAAIDPGTGGTSLASVATLSALIPSDTVEANNSRQAAVRVQSADLSVAIAAGAAAPNVGDTLAYTVTLANAGPDSATAVVVTDRLPAGLTFVDATPSQGAYAAATGAWSAGALASGESATLVLRASVDPAAAGATIADTVAITAATQEDPDPSNDSASVSVAVPSADLAITIAANRTVANQGDLVRYTITLSNNGPDAASNVVVADRLPVGLNYQSDLPSQGSYERATGVWSAGDLPSGSVATLVLNTVIDAGAAGIVITNRAALTGADQADPDPANNRDSIGVQLTSTDLRVALAIDRAAPTVGDTVLITVTLANDGPDAGTNVALVDRLPAGLAYRTSTASRGSYAPATGLWSVGALASGDSATLALSAIVGSSVAGTAIDDTAEVVAADQGDPDLSDNRAILAVTVESADLAVRLSSSAATATTGDTIVYSIDVTNGGPSDASGVTVLDRLPAGLVPLAHSASQGAYDWGTGLWSVGGLGAGAVATLSLSAIVAPPASTISLTDTARLVAASPYDPDSSNDSALVTVVLRGADLAVRLAAAPSRPEAGDTLTFTVTLVNAGPLDAGAIAVTSGLPAAVAYVDQSASQGGWAPATGLWSVGSIAAGDSASLVLRTTVNAEAAATAITDTAAVTASDQEDPRPSNDRASLVVGVPGADLAVTLAAVPAFASTAEPIAITLIVANLGPDTATTVRVTSPLPAELIEQSSQATSGAWSSATGVWTIASLPPSRRDTLRIATMVATGIPTGRVVMTARAGARQGDPAAANDTARVAMDLNGYTLLTTRPIAQRAVTLAPGGSRGEVLRIPIVNRVGAPIGLDAVTLTNRTLGPGTQAQLDAEWQPLSLSVLGGAAAAGPRAESTPAPVAFANGKARWSGLAITIAPHDSVVLVVESGASTAAREGDLLDLEVAAASDLEFSGPVSFDNAWPVSPSGSFPVNGMTAAQIAVVDIGERRLQTGSRHNLAFAAVLPANGYTSDVLQKLNLVNHRGTAKALVDIARVELWRDADGNGAFDPALDAWIRALEFTGDRWEATGLSTAIPAAGLRVFVSCDLTETAVEGRTVRFELPTFPDPGVGVLSDNDGPVDASVAGTEIHTISSSDRIVLTAIPVAAGALRPGAKGVPLLRFRAHNAYTTARVLSGLTVSRVRDLGGTSSQRDNEVQQLNLRLDANRDGQLGDFDTDPLLGTTSFAGDRATFAGLDLALPPATEVEIFVTANVSSTGAADASLLGARIDDADGIAFTENTAVAASWPLVSGDPWTIDGMVAAQIANLGAPVRTLGRNDGPALALDVVVPRNGWADDVLEQVQIVQAGTATTSDLAEVRLWRDGGNGVFDSGSGDDRDLGAMTYSAGRWLLSLSEPLASGGARLFAAVRTGATVTDSATIRLRIPELGLQVQSGNDGPIDTTVTNPNELRLSNSNLLATIELTPGASTVGRTVTARMRVDNVGGNPLQGIAPSALVQVGDGMLTMLSGPTPASLDLAPGAGGFFEWQLRADSAGIVAMRGSASGTEAGSGLLVASVTTQSNAHRVSLQAVALDVFSTGSMPFAVNRGQTQVVPLSVTFTNPGGAEASDVRVRRLTLRLENSASGAIVPASLISRVVLNEGTTVYIDKTTLESGGSTIDLPLAQPVDVQSGGGSSRQVTLSVRFDISEVTTVPNFRVVLDSEQSIAAEDAISGSPVTIQLDTGQTFPLRTALARVVTEATELDVSPVAGSPRTAARGQSGVTVLDVSLHNPGPEGLGSDVRLSAIGVHLLDSGGAVVRTPDRVLKRLRLTAGLQTYVDRGLDAQDDSTITLVFSSLLSLPVATPTTLSIVATIADTADLGTYRVRLADAPTLAPRDANTGEIVPAIYTATPIEGASWTVQARSDTVRVSRIAQLPPTLPVGSQDVAALTVRLRHPGPPSAAQLECRNLTVRCRNQGGDPLVPSEYLDRVRVLRGGAEVGLVTNLPSQGGEVAVPVSGVRIGPGEIVELEVRLDARITAPATLFEMSVGASGIGAFDVNLDVAAAVAADDGAELPLASGLTQLQQPARELLATFAESMPAVLAADGGTVPVATLTLRNTAATTAGVIQLDALELIASDHDHRPLPIGGAVTRVQAMIADTVWAEIDALPDTATAARLTGSSPLLLDPSIPVDVSIRITTRSGAAARSLRIGCDAGGIIVRQPGSALLSVAVRAGDGQAFPFWTEPGNFSAASLAASWSNFPNPFAAGREATRFVFYLHSPARVTVNVWTSRGDRVTTLGSNGTLGAGLHQQLSWDGRNFRGQPVYNGVYVAELLVRYDDGSSARLLRNLVVVR